MPSWLATRSARFFRDECILAGSFPLLHFWPRVRRDCFSGRNLCSGIHDAQASVNDNRRFWRDRRGRGRNSSPVLLRRLKRLGAVVRDVRTVLDLGHCRPSLAARVPRLLVCQRQVRRVQSSPDAHGKIQRSQDHRGPTPAPSPRRKSSLVVRGAADERHQFRS